MRIKIYILFVVVYVAGRNLWVFLHSVHVFPWVCDALVFHPTAVKINYDNAISFWFHRDHVIKETGSFNVVTLEKSGWHGNTYFLYLFKQMKKGRTLCDQPLYV